MDTMNTDKPNGSVDSSRWLILALVCVGTFMATLDVSIVTVAMPTLTAAFRTDVGTSQWFVLSYQFVITVLLMVFGKLGDIAGRKRIYTIGILVFVAGSLACGLSVSALMLILMRGLQGVGSAMTMSGGPALVTEAFPARERGRALGLIGSAVALGLLTGPLVGGIIVEYANWRWMFLLNVPIGLALAALITARVQGFDSRRDQRLDLPGAVLMTGAVAALVFGLTFGGNLGWTSAGTVSLLLASACSAVFFVLVERRVEDPLVHLGLFGNREFTIGAVTGWANYAAMMPVSVFIPFYLQNLLHYSPGRVGMILAFGPLTLAFVAPVAGSLSDRIGSRLLTSVGLLIAGAGILTMQWLVPGSSAFGVIWRLVLAAVGSALFVSPNSSSVMGSVKTEDLGIAGGTVALVRNLGMVCGVALAGAIITTVQANFHVTGEIAGSVEAVSAMAFLAGLKSALLACAGIALFGAFMSAMRVRPGDREAFEKMG